MGTDYRILEKEFADRCESLFQNTQLNQGDVFFFNRRLVHRGGKNLSDKRRNALIFQSTFLFGIGQHAFDMGAIFERLEKTKLARQMSAEDRRGLAWRLRAPYPLDTRLTT